MLQKIRALLAVHGRLSVPVDTFATDQNLRVAGLTSFAAVQLMLALEEAFDVEFPEDMMNRQTFASIDAIAISLDVLARARIASAARTPASSVHDTIEVAPSRHNRP